MKLTAYYGKETRWGAGGVGRGGEDEDGAACGLAAGSCDVATTSSRQVKVLPNGMENVSRDMRAGIINYFAH